MATWRLYIDESGDHAYKHLGNPYQRYLGVTGVLVRKNRYDSQAQPALERLKQDIFRYDPDDPPILTRSHIRSRKRWFYVLQDKDLNERWEAALLEYLRSLVPFTQVFTVVIDKKRHLELYPNQTFDAYTYSLAVLLNRVRGYLRTQSGKADVLAESRGKVEDEAIRYAYGQLRANGSTYGDGPYYSEYYPEETLMVRKKSENIGGLQIADILAYGQKILTIQENHKPYPAAASAYTQKVNQAARRMVNRYGRYMLE